jgi:hypothetical protein
MRIDSCARFALLGALVVSLGCARNTENGDETGATGRATAADTGATVRVRPDTTVSPDTLGRAHPDSATGGAAPARPGTADSARPGMAPVDTAMADTSAGPGWPVDTMQGGGWATPPDSGQ